MANNKLTADEIKNAALKVVEYENKMKALQTEYAQYRKIFRLHGKNTIDSEWSLQWPLSKIFDKKEASRLSHEIFIQILSEDPDLAYKNLKSQSYDYNTKKYKNDGYRETCFQCLLNHPDKLFKKIDEHNTNKNSWRNETTLTPEELDIIWEKLGSYYIEQVRNTVVDFSTLYDVFGDRFTYDDKALLVKRIMGRSRETKAIALAQDPNMPEDLKDQLEAYLILQKLK
jgi:hypothetical protein